MIQRRAILVFSLAVLFLFYKYLIEVSPSVMTDMLMRFFHINAVALGNIAASYYYIYFLMQLPMGILLDRFGPRRTITTCILLCAAGTLIFVFAHSFLTACTGRFITGLGASAAAIGTLKIITLWFDRKYFAMLAGLMMTIGMLGAVFGEAPLSMAIDYFNWHNTNLFLATCGGILAFIFWCFVRDKAPYANTIQDKPTPSVLQGLLHCLAKRQTWLLSLYSGVAFAPITAFGGLWGVSFLHTTYHLTKTQAAFSASLIFIGFAIGAPVLGFLSEKHGKRKPLMNLGTIIALIILLVIVYSPYLPLIIIQALLVGFGFCLSGFLLCFAMLREINPLIFAGTVLGFMNSFDAAMSAITDPLMGHILDKGRSPGLVNVFPGHDYRIAMSVLVIYMVVAILLLPTLKETHCRQTDDHIGDNGVA